MVEKTREGGPLTGVRVLEFAGIGPAPFCGMLLADAGADVLRIDRPAQDDLGIPVEPRFDVTSRGRRSIALDLKQREAIETALALVEKADILIEGFRPGVMERLGLGPDVCFARNKQLVYGRMTGWGQTGPLANAAGHDLNYIALSGVLHAIGRDGPVPPLNLVGDYGGGGAYLGFGVLAALVDARQSGRGQVVDAAMTDGSASLMAIIYGLLAAGRWRDQRGANTLDGGAPWYDVYETADGKHVAIGPIEGRFFAEMLRRLELDPSQLPPQHDEGRWPELRQAFASAFKSRTREEWCRRLEGTDVCFAPVLSMKEAPAHPHNAARATFIERDDVTQPAPAPRFSRTRSVIRRGAPRPGEGGAEALAEWGFGSEAIAAFQRAGAQFERK